MRRSARHIAAILGGILLGAAPAGAEIARFVLDPARSFVRVEPASGLRILFGPPFEAPALPLAKQLGILPGVSALAQDAVPGPPDGRATALEGFVLAFAIPSIAAPLAVELQSMGTILAPRPSGTWLPGEPETESVAAPAQLAFVLTDPVFGFDVPLALRGAALQVALPYSAATNLGSGRFGLAPNVSGTLAGGFLDVGAADLGVATRFEFERTTLAAAAASGQLRDLGAGNVELRLPFSFTASAGPAALPLPLDASLAISGEIVAYTVPESDALASGGLALAALLVLRRRGGAR